MKVDLLSRICGVTLGRASPGRCRSPPGALERDRRRFVRFARASAPVRLSSFWQRRARYRGSFRIVRRPFAKGPLSPFFTEPARQIDSAICITNGSAVRRLFKTRHFFVQSVFAKSHQGLRDLGSIFEELWGATRVVQWSHCIVGSRCALFASVTQGSFSTS
jgi:hypothetical protein